jgi:hypothetical protein
MVKIYNIGYMPWILSFSFYKTIRFGYSLLFHLITNQWVANGSSRSNVMLMAKHKAHLLARGIPQVEGIDFNET